MPLDPFTQIEDIGCIVQRLPAFGQIGLHAKGAGLHVGADFMPHQFAVDKAHGALRKASEREMVIKVRGVKPAHAQGATAPGLPRLCPPEYGGMGQGPGRQRHASRQAGFEQLTTTYT